MTEIRAKSDSVIRGRARSLGWLLLIAAVAQAIAPGVQFLADVVQPGDGENLIISPPGWAFAIWGVIYLLAIAHAIVTLRIGDGVGSRRFVIGLIALYTSSVVWIIVSSTGASWATFLVLVVMTVLAVDAARIAAAAPASDPTWIGTLARATSGVFAGWASAAVFLNLGSAVLEFDIADATQHWWQIVLLACAAVLALAVNSRMGRSFGYAAAVAWALVGIIASASGQSTVATVVAVLALVAIGAQTALRAFR